MKVGILILLLAAPPDSPALRSNVGYVRLTQMDDSQPPQVPELSQPPTLDNGIQLVPPPEPAGESAPDGTPPGRPESTPPMYGQPPHGQPPLYGQPPMHGQQPMDGQPPMDGSPSMGGYPMMGPSMQAPPAAGPYHGGGSEESYCPTGGGGGGALPWITCACAGDGPAPDSFTHKLLFQHVGLCGGCMACSDPSMLKRFRAAKFLSTCDMCPYQPYLPEAHGYYYFRPYNHTHIAQQQAIAASWGDDPRSPYTTRLFEKLYVRMGAPPVMYSPPLGMGRFAPTRPSDHFRAIGQ